MELFAECCEGCFNQGELRRLISILLLAVLGLPLAAPLFAATSQSESRLPACCRKNGKHHCMGGMEMQAASSAEPSFRTPLEKCPFAPAMPAVLHGKAGTPGRVQRIGARLAVQPVVGERAESKRLACRTRSHQKRGPPAERLSL